MRGIAASNLGSTVRTDPSRAVRRAPLVGHEAVEEAADVSKGNRKKAKKRQRSNTPTSGHHRRSGRLVPPMANLPNLTPVPWLSDVFPDMLWLCFLVTEDQDDGMRAANATLRLIDEAIRETNEGELLARPVDGRLTRLEVMPDSARRRAIDLLEERDAYEVAVPEAFAHALGMYPDAPGSWLIRPWLERGLTVDWEQARDALAPVIEICSYGAAEAPTRAKFIVLTRMAASGKLSMPPEQVGLFRRYPDGLTEGERHMVDPMVRASFMAMLAADEHREDRAMLEGANRLAWAQRFWRSNWSIFPCVPLNDESPITTGEDLGDVFDAYRNEVSDLHRRFLETANRVDPDLYNPDRYEVLTGLVNAGIRSVSAAALSPASWSGEHGMMTVRSLVESLIVIRWLLHRGDSSLYGRFKDYGRGHLKLLKLNLEEYIDSLKDPPEHLLRSAEVLDREVNAEVWEEWQEIDLGRPFAGVSIRDMAIEVHLTHEYKFLFAPASATAHREWTMLDRYALKRCLSPIHRWHRIPNDELSTMLGPDMMDTALGLVDELVTTYIEAFKD
jgi:hypothetical protein